MDDQVLLPRAILPRQSYTLTEVMTATGWGRNRLFRIIAEGRLKTFRHGRCRYVTPAALAACIKELERETEVEERPRRASR